MNSSIESTRKLYVRPVVEEVQMVAEEAVLATCKNNAGASGESSCQAAGDLGCTSSARS
ncbi:MAG TPA: hypothetical protein PKV82_07165 [Anaerolineae bacterium]|nr:hypothetical protein [Anaerolineae bacterium]